MNDTLNKVFIFAAGTVIGSAVTWKIIKTKYEQIANKEIESVKERFRNRENAAEDDASDEEKNVDNSLKDRDLSSYESIINENAYRNYSTPKGSENEIKEEESVDGPYVIPPEEYDENDYETESLTYYADGVLTDIYDNIIEDVEGTVGTDSLTHFGEYEDDSVFVRNDERQIDYEILLDSDKYYDKYPEERQ